MDGTAVRRVGHVAADGADDVEIAFDDVALRMRAADGARDVVAAFAHVDGAELAAFRRFREIRDGSGFEEALEVEHEVVAAALDGALERAEMMKEAADRAESLLFKDDDVIDAGVHFDDAARGGLDNPGDAAVRPFLLELVADGQGVHDVADGAELDDEDVFRGHPRFPSISFRIFSMTFVVERPATRSTNSTRPP